MRVLATEGSSPLGAAILAALAADHQVRVLRQDPVRPPSRPEAVEVVPCELADADGVWQAMRGVDAVVHTGRVTWPQPEDELERERLILDIATRGTHVLFQAARDAGVRRLVYCSTLELFADYPDDVYISELWRPRPGTDMRVLSHHLAEQVTREFARDFALSVTVLRLGRLVAEEEAPAGDPDPMWLDPRDAAAAVALALGRDRSASLSWQSRWEVCHVCAAPPHPKYLIDSARRLGFAPQHNFQSRWV